MVQQIYKKYQHKVAGVVGGLGRKENEALKAQRARRKHEFEIG
jgi:hypothetical protein